MQPLCRRRCDFDATKTLFVYVSHQWARPEEEPEVHHIAYMATVEAVSIDAGGSVYEGELLEGVKFSGPRVGTGKASWISPLGVISREGQGKMCFAPGEVDGGGVHEGAWADGQPMGVGRRVFADGTVHEVISTSR